jgi:hypothetical protein
MDKTYQELKEEPSERGAGVMAVVQAPAPPEPEVMPEAEPEAEPEMEAEVEPEVEVEVKPMPKPRVKRPVKAKAEEKPKARPKAERKLKAKPEPRAESKAEAVVEEEKPEIEPIVEEAVEVKAEVEQAAEVVKEPEFVPLPKPEIVADATAITVEEMHAAFKESSATAEKRFADKIFHVTGVVSIVAASDEAETPSVILTSHDITAMENIVCMFEEKYREEISRLAEGKTVKVQGKYESRARNIIILSNCVLIT